MREKKIERIKIEGGFEKIKKIEKGEIEIN